MVQRQLQGEGVKGGGFDLPADGLEEAALGDQAVRHEAGQREGLADGEGTVEQRDRVGVPKALHPAEPAQAQRDLGVGRVRLPLREGLVRLAEHAEGLGRSGLDGTQAAQPRGLTDLAVGLVRLGGGEEQPPHVVVPQGGPRHLAGPFQQACGVPRVDAETGGCLKGEQSGLGGT